MRQNRSSPDEDRSARLARRVEELETRVRLLEAHVRELKAQARAAQVPAAEPKPKLRAARSRPRPRCPGCLLELPKGRPRGETCVWCGFMFSAVGGRMFR